MAASSAKTYFIRFDGYSFHIDRIFPTKDLEKIFNELFNEEKGWTELQELFDGEFDIESNTGKNILGCPIPKDAGDSYDYLAAFVKYYVGKGHLQFFSDVDKTWTEQECVAYAFVNDLSKMLTILKNCIAGDGDDTLLVDSFNTEHLKTSNYVKNVKNNKRKTKA